MEFHFVWNDFHEYIVTTFRLQKIAYCPFSWFVVDISVTFIIVYKAFF